jgi:hypothetical protein
MRRRATPPTAAMPASISAQVPCSGTGTAMSQPITSRVAVVDREVAAGSLRRGVDAGPAEVEEVVGVGVGRTAEALAVQRDAAHHLGDLVLGRADEVIAALGLRDGI